MSTSIETISTQLQTNTKNQRTPTTLTSDDYLKMAILGTKKFYIDIGEESNWDSEFDGTNTVTKTMNILEFEYCVLASEIVFYEQLICGWNDLVSYTTNALSVTNAMKPYDAIKGTLDRKRTELVNLFYKMTNYTSMSDIDSVDVEKVDYEFE